MNTKIRLLIVDDHKMFLEGLISLLKDVENIEITGTALNGKQALEILKTHNVDVVVTDVSMPEMDGIELSEEIRKNFPAVSTLVLSSHSDPAIISKLINSQVNGYLLKNAEKEELKRAIYSISEGNNYFSETIRQIHINHQFSRPQATNIVEQLSKREYQVLKLIADEFTTNEIADELNLSQHTIETHRRNMLSKLGVRNTAGLIKFTMQNKLLDE
jgi:DNA-binding NarL/FixJ family response regulator